MKSIKLFIVLALLLPAVAGGQAVFNTTNMQKVQLEVSELQQAIQTSKPSGITLEFDTTTISVDGQMMRGPEFVQSLASIITTMPNRNLVMANPLPDKLGTLWDFEIVEPDYQLTSDSCIVNFQYRLLASGVRLHPGRIEFVKQRHGWRMTKLDGLLAFLTDELNVIKGGKNNREQLK